MHNFSHTLIHFTPNLNTPHSQRRRRHEAGVDSHADAGISTLQARDRLGVQRLVLVVVDDQARELGEGGALPLCFYVSVSD